MESTEYSSAGLLTDGRPVSGNKPAIGSSAARDVPVPLVFLHKTE